MNGAASTAAPDQCAGMVAEQDQRIPDFYYAHSTAEMGYEPPRLPTVGRSGVARYAAAPVSGRGGRNGTKSDINSPVPASARHSASSAAQKSAGRPSGPAGTNPTTKA